MCRCLFLKGGRPTLVFTFLPFYHTKGVNIKLHTVTFIYIALFNVKKRYIKHTEKYYVKSHSVITQIYDFKRLFLISFPLRFSITLILAFDVQRLLSLRNNKTSAN